MPESAKAGVPPAPAAPGERSTSGLRDANLIGRDLSGQDLSNADLSGRDLSGADLTATRLLNANLSGASLYGATLDRAHLLGANLRGADLTNASAVATIFASADLDDAVLFNANAEQATFVGATMQRCDARSAQLRAARVRDADLGDAEFRSAVLDDADLSGANVAGTDFALASLRGARLHHLRGFVDADWTGVDISGVDFTGAYTVRRTIIDENYLYEFRSASRTNAAVYLLWKLTSDCGRSLGRWAVVTMAMATIFAVAYTQVSLDYGDYETSLSPLYFSVVTLTTLGYGDVLPASLAAQVVVLAEVLIGYVMLGGLLSIFATKMGRRGE